MEKLNILELVEGNGVNGTIAVVTHAGVFHADDVTACGLVATYDDLANRGSKVILTRVPHQANIEEVVKILEEEYNATRIYVADIGRVYDARNLRFDHHQYGQKDKEFGNAAAGLVYKYFKDTGRVSKYEAVELDPFIKMVDENDIGIYQGPYEGTFPWMVSLQNSTDIYSKQQDVNFVKAVLEAMDIIINVKLRACQKEDAIKTLKEAKEVLPKVLEMPEYLPGWNDIIFDIEEFNHIDLVIWHDKVQNTWKIQQVPDAPGSFGRRGRPVPYRNPLPDGCEFLHKGNFFGVFDSKEALIDYIKSI